VSEGGDHPAGDEQGAAITDAFDVCAVEDLPPGSVKVIELADRPIAIFNAAGELYAIEDRCTHDDGTLAEGDFDQESCIVTCPRHGAEFDLQTGRALTLPAYLPVETFEVVVLDGRVRLRPS
jgi:3-phenylpropionate/trans-cinnamate dioxygenase ferredoxin subunit